MKYALIILPLLLVSCSSAPKKDIAAAPKPVAASAPAPVVEAPKADAARTFEAHCKQGTDERVLSVASKSSGCELNYTKFAKSSVAASAETGTKHCEEVLKKIQKHLEASGFVCK